MNTTHPPSPCVQICTLAPGIIPGSECCVGCLRTLDEIARWESLSAMEKHALLDALKQRAIQTFAVTAAEPH